MSRRKKSQQSHGTANRPRLWGKHAVAAALGFHVELPFTPARIWAAIRNPPNG